MDHREHIERQRALDIQSVGDSRDGDGRQGPEGAKGQKLEELWRDSRTLTPLLGFWKYFDHLKTMNPTLSNTEYHTF